MTILRGNQRIIGLLLILAPIAIAVLAIGVGRYQLSPVEVIQALAAGSGDGAAERVVWSMRLPRVLLAMLVGAGLSSAGMAYQSLFANPLATPDTLGVAAGASFGAVLGILLGFSMIGVQLFALAAGFAAVCLTYFAGRNGKHDSLVGVVLAGIMIASLFNALISLVKYLADPESQLPSITYWLMGSLNSADYDSLLLGVPPMMAGMLILFLTRWRLNILPLSDDEARSTGTDLRLLRFLTVLSATMITASAVSMCGQVGWIGLIVPHICRMLVGTDASRLIPASLSVGAVFLLIVDTCARCLTAAEIPVSILTALAGAPVFLFLLRRTGGWSL